MWAPYEHLTGTCIYLLLLIVDKDVNRTDRIVSFFSGDNNDKLQQLNDILMTYMMYNFDLGKTEPCYYHLPGITWILF